MQMAMGEQRPAFLPRAAAWFFEITCKQPRSGVVRYLLPFIGILLALLTQGGIQRMISKETDFPYAFLYLIAVFAVAWFGGYGPGAVACLLLMVGFPAAASRGASLRGVDPSRLIFMLGVSLGVSGMAHAQRRRRESLHRANDELDQRVRRRTRDLDCAIESLQLEI